MTWNGTSWKVRYFSYPSWADPRREGQSSLEQVECPLVDVCAATGFVMADGDPSFIVPQVTVRGPAGLVTGDLPTPAGFDVDNQDQHMVDLFCSRGEGQCTADSHLAFTDGTHERVIFVDEYPWWQPFVVAAPDGGSLTAEGGTDCSGAGVCVGVATDSASRPVVIR